MVRLHNKWQSPALRLPVRDVTNLAFFVSMAMLLIVTFPASLHLGPACYWLFLV